MLRPHHVPAGPALARVEAQDLPAPLRDHAVDARRGLVGDGDLHLHDRLEQHRAALGHALGHADAAGLAEGHVGGVDRMVGAVGQRHRHVDHREAAERPVLQIVRHADLDRGDELPRHHAAGDLLGELEAGAARQRLDVEHHVAELAVAARLLLVPAADLDALADRLLVGHAGAACDSASTPYLRLSRSSATRRCISPWPHSTIWCVSLACSRLSEGSSSISLASAPGQLHLVLAVLDADGDAVDGLRRLGRLDLRAAALLGRQRLAGIASSPAGRAPPCRRPWPRARFLASWPSIENAAAARSSDLAPCTTVPSPNSPASTRTIDSLPPCGV